MILTIRTWLVAVRAPFFTASVVPVAVGVLAARYDGFAVSLWLAAITLVGVVAAHAAANLANDYFDHRSGNDWVNRYRSPFNGGSGAIQSGLLSPDQMLIGAAVMLTAAAVSGAVLAAVRGWPVLALAAAGGISALAYTAGPVRLAYRGFGELMVAANFGLLPVLGSYYVQTGELGWTAVAASLPVAVLITAVLYVNQFPDVEADASVSKRNLVVRMGTARAARGYVVLLAAAYGTVLAGVALGGLPVHALATWLTLPLAVWSAGIVRRHHDDPRSIIPACALTVVWHLATGILLVVGLLWGGGV